MVKGIDLPAISAQLDKLDRAADFLALVQKSVGSGETPYQKLSGGYSVSAGVLTSDNIELVATAAAGKGTAVVNLPVQEMDSQFRFWLSEHPNSPPIGVRFVGPLDNPRRVLDLDKLQAYVLQRLVERGVLRNFDTNSGGTGSAVDALKGILKVPGSERPAPPPAAAPTTPVEPATPAPPTKT